MNFTTGVNDACTFNNGDTVTIPTCNDTSAIARNHATTATATKELSTELFPQNYFVLQLFARQLLPID